jgi:hypothetical protein
MADKLTIPPVFVEAETSPQPPIDAFQKCPLQQIAAGDLVLLQGQVWRVKNRRASRTSPRITITLWPVLGGRPQTRSYFPREWLPALRAAQTP